ncbi:hypothetical protein SIN8267_00866 [Sinobacterium norvegicum]|uniref:Uncharacterized protein n=1 Tax=Sinobacterium norvegicum TaxID=1641715 RepID=A0ABM9ACU1_9GAMM|nr:hypothetical protein [Sinobacterium norvegicum]CAH0990767.1 hypothetical protein SIN8267_00866 [Sinobacterium norvegicum]
MEQPHSTMYLDHTDQQLEDYIDAIIDLVDFDFAVKTMTDYADPAVSAPLLAKQLTEAFERDALYGIGFESLEEEQFLFSLIAGEYRHGLMAATSEAQQLALADKLDPLFAVLASVLAAEMLG